MDIPADLSKIENDKSNKGTEKKFTISFIIPTYNEEKFLPKVLTAIKKLVINLRYEIIVVDNGSTDATPRIAESYCAKVIIDASKTIAGLRNLGAQNASGNILVFLDGDVILTKEWTKNIFDVIKQLEIDNKIITGSRCGISLNPSWIEKHWFLPMTFEKSNYINSGHLIINKNVFKELGGFNEQFKTGEDWEFCIRAKNRGVFKIINNPNLYVIHEGYPKTIREFIRREIWHGIQDVNNIYSFIHSKPSIFSLLYLSIGICGIVFFINHKSINFLLTAVILNSTLCFIASLQKRKKFPLNLFYYFLIFHLYFFARGLSLFYKILNIFPSGAFKARNCLTLL